MAKISVKDKNCKYVIMNEVLTLIENDRLPPVVLCVGSRRIAGDILGPLVGDMLINQYNIRAFVYGTLSRPITALNLSAAHIFIQKNHPGAKILAIDAALGSKEGCGFININRGAIKPGAALGKKLPEIGDYHITANVNIFGRENIVALTKTRFGDVYDFAENIAFGINDALALKKGMELYA